MVQRAVIVYPYVCCCKVCRKTPMPKGAQCASIRSKRASAAGSEKGKVAFKQAHKPVAAEHSDILRLEYGTSAGSDYQALLGSYRLDCHRLASPEALFAFAGKDFRDLHIGL